MPFFIASALIQCNGTQMTLMKLARLPNPPRGAFGYQLFTSFLYAPHSYLIYLTPFRFPPGGKGSSAL